MSTPASPTGGVHKHIDTPSLLVILLTLVLFATALVIKGIGHDLLLEGGVFLVSVKLILMAYKASVANERLLDELASVRSAMSRLEHSLDTGSQLAGGPDVTPLRGQRRGVDERTQTS